MTTYIRYKDIKVLFVDFTDCNLAGDMNDVLAQTIDVVKDQPDASILALVDFTGIPVGTDFVSTARKINRAYFAQKVKAQSILGVDTPMRKVFLNSYNSLTPRRLEPFDNKKEALEYLYMQNQRAS